MRQAVLFDIDDTLYAWRDYAESALRAVAAFLARIHERDEAEIREALLETFRREGRERVLDKALAALRLPHEPEDILRAVYLYRTHSPEIRLAPGAQSLLEDLSGRFDLGAVTNGAFVTQVNKVRALGLDRLLGPIVYADVLGSECWKPHPAPFLIARALFPHARAFTYVGNDPAADVPGAREAGFRTVILRQGREELDALPAELRPDVIAEELADLPPLLDAIAAESEV